MEKKKHKIFIVDDEVDFCYFLKENLELKGDFDVTTCSDSTRALEEILRVQPDMILLDILMPGKDGFTLLRAIRAHEKLWRLPVIMLTAKGDSQSIFEGKKYLATDYIIKPFQIKELIKFVMQYLRVYDAQPEKK